MLAEFIDFVNTEKWDLDAIQISEVLWFVQQVSPLVTVTDNIPEDEQESLESEDFTESNSEPAVIVQPNFVPPRYPLTIESESPEINISNAVSEQIESPETTTSNPVSEQTAFPPEIEKLPIKLPDTGIFRNTLQLGRLAKPLKKKINSRIVQELDIKETVRRSAELSTPQFPIYFPVLTPKKEHWLDVALLIEDSESMILWQSLLKEVREFLENLGAFRDIKCYRIKWDGDLLQINSFHSFSYPFTPQQLNVHGGRRLILLISDCISPAWTSHKFIEILQEWSNKQILTLLNPFPFGMWKRTNLDYSIKIRLGNDKQELPTQQWEAIPLESWQLKGVDQQTLVKLPILSLESESMAAWVNVMMGKGTSWCAGVWLRYQEEEEEEDQEEEDQDIIKQINSF